MFRNHKEIETAVHILVEHLDAALDVADALMSLSYEPRELSDLAATQEILERNSGIRGFVEQARALELALLTKLHQARQWSDRLIKLDKGCRPAAKLFKAGTQALQDAILQTADRSMQAFDDGDQVLCYLKDRALVPVSAISLDGIAQIGIDENMLLCGWGPLGAVLDVFESYITALEVEFRFLGAQVAETQDEEHAACATEAVATPSLQAGGKTTKSPKPSAYIAEYNAELFEAEAPAPVEHDETPSEQIEAVEVDSRAHQGSPAVEAKDNRTAGTKPSERRNEIAQIATRPVDGEPAEPRCERELDSLESKLARLECEDTTNTFDRNNGEDVYEAVVDLAAPVPVMEVGLSKPSKERRLQ